MFCKYCGIALESEALFCSSCGKRLDAGTSENAESPEQETAEFATLVPSQAESLPLQSQGKAQNPSEGEHQVDAQDGAQQESDQVSSSGAKAESNKRETSSLCVLGLIFTVLSVFLNYYWINELTREAFRSRSEPFAYYKDNILFSLNCFGIVAFAAIIVSIIGYYRAKKKGQRGVWLAIICMILSVVMCVIWLIYSTVIRSLPYIRFLP